MMSDLQSYIDGIYSRGRIKIDLLDLLRQLNTTEASELIKRYLQGNYRMHSVLKEQADRAAGDRMDFVSRHLEGCTYIRDQFRYIESKRDHIISHLHQSSGSILDCGIWKGNTTRALARIFPSIDIQAFDSLEGLPDDWVTSIKGTFKLSENELNELDLPQNCNFYKGWFSNTLPVWKSNESFETISLIRVDCDIYSSTKNIFDVVGDMMVEGTIIIFDELIGYMGWERHEYKAFNEFLLEHPSIEFRYESFGETYVAGVVHRI